MNHHEELFVFRINYAISISEPFSWQDRSVWRRFSREISNRRRVAIIFCLCTWERFPSSFRWRKNEDIFTGSESIFCSSRVFLLCKNSLAIENVNSQKKISGDFSRGNLFVGDEPLIIHQSLNGLFKHILSAVDGSSKYWFRFICVNWYARCPKCTIR